MVAPEQIQKTLKILAERNGRIPYEVFVDPHLGLHRSLAAGEVASDKLIEWLVDMELVQFNGFELASTPLGGTLGRLIEEDGWKTEMALATLAAPKCRSAVKGFADRAYITPTGQVAIKTSTPLTEKERGLLFLYRRLGMAEVREAQWILFGEVGETVAAELQVGLTPADLYRILSVQRRIGDLGERLVLHEEVERLGKVVPELSSRVRRISLENAAAGFDIQSFEGKGGLFPDRFIEVKTTTGETPHFFLSRGEIKQANMKRSKYLIACVLGADLSSQTCKEIRYFRDPISSVLDSADFKVEPTTFEVTWKLG